MLPANLDLRDRLFHIVRVLIDLDVVAHHILIQDAGIVQLAALEQIDQPG